MYSVFEMPNTNPPTSTFDEINKKLDAALKTECFVIMHFISGATPNNMKELAAVDTLKGCCGVKLFAGSSAERIFLVSQEKDIEKVISNSSKIISVHSEDENILLSRKKYIKDGDVHSHPNLEK